jgi:hypothetical protein
MNRGIRDFRLDLAELIPDAEVRVLPRPSQPVRLQRVTYEGRSKTARYREVSQI